jgi:hypothetical protein
MKITKRQLRRIIRESVTSENRQLFEFFGKKKATPPVRIDAVHQKKIVGIGDVKAAWTPDGLTMEIYTDDKLSF